ncbi:hypothetical protein E6O75_ATG03904 [Venturia nashicola]|uniref:Uncharacterized protein n=1 Tax=Venturia nashicola TaxID=86259 RepID=A0A4Z1PJT1_9PEZI|nr:hypothetical protein E6O75_ATG03904 [Venturia nashicola]
MKLSIALSLLAYIASISAETHQFCCCSSKTKNQCLHDETTWVRDGHKGPEVWNFYDGTFSDSDGAPFNCATTAIYTQAWNTGTGVLVVNRCLMSVTNIPFLLGVCSSSKKYDITPGPSSPSPKADHVQTQNDQKVIEILTESTIAQREWS